MHRWDTKREYVDGCAAELCQMCPPHISKQKSHFEINEVLLSGSPLLNNKSDLLWNQPLKET
jgi:hypothetical protein